jgi:hypothetical protein
MRTEIPRMKNVLIVLLPVWLAAADPAMFRGGPAHSGVYPSPAGISAGSSDHFLYALATTDGTVRWKAETGGAVNSSPAVGGCGVLYERRRQSLRARCRRRQTEVEVQDGW